MKALDSRIKRKNSTNSPTMPVNSAVARVGGPKKTSKEASTGDNGSKKLSELNAASTSASEPSKSSNTKPSVEKEPKKLSKTPPVPPPSANGPAKPVISSSTNASSQTKPLDSTSTRTGDLAGTLSRLKTEFDKKYQENRVSDSSEKLKEYMFLAILGQGAFGLVKLVKHEPSEEFYAVKIISKEKVVKSKQVKHTLNEKKILSCIDFPFVVCLNFSFKDNSYVYFGMPFINGGEMFTHLRKAKKFQEDLAKFYAAQVVLGLEYIHKMEMVYRDLKPENVMVDHRGFLKITDFGMCKLLKNNRAYTLCGTPEYIAPEIVSNKGYGKSVDWWSFGILVFEMNAGYSPFSVGDPGQMEMMEKIVSGKFKIPSTFGMSLRQIIQNLLQIDLTKRFGNLRDGVQDIKSHAWFKKIDWMNILEQTVKPPFVPKVSGPGDYTQFDKYDDVPLKVAATNQYEKDFADF